MRTILTNDVLYISVHDLADNLAKVADNTTEVASLMADGPDKVAMLHHAAAVLEVTKSLAAMLDKPDSGT